MFFTLDTASNDKNFADSTLLPSHDSLVWYSPSRVQPQFLQFNSGSSKKPEIQRDRSQKQ
jgi:hypothetical protein